MSPSKPTWSWRLLGRLLMERRYLCLLSRFEHVSVIFVAPSVTYLNFFALLARDITKRILAVASVPLITKPIEAKHDKFRIMTTATRLF